LLVATYVLSCLCIPVSNTVVEWVFSHDIFVFKMKKICDFEFRTGINPVSFLPVFLRCVHGVFNTPAQWLLRHKGSSGFARVFDYDLYWRTQACLLMFVPPPTVRSHFTKMLTRAIFFGPCHCLYIFIPCLSFHVHVTGDLNKTISFVVGVFTTPFARALLGFIH